jgi:hypothetical protein
MKKPGRISLYANLEDGILDSVLDLTEAELDSELEELGFNPADREAQARAAVTKGIMAARKVALKAARSELDRFKGRQANTRNPTDVVAGREMFERIKAGDSGLSSKMMMAARKGEGLTENDIDGIAEDLADLQKLGKESDQ